MQLYPGWSARDNYVSGQQHTVGMGRGTFQIPCPPVSARKAGLLSQRHRGGEVVDWRGSRPPTASSEEGQARGAVGKDRPVSFFPPRTYSHSMQGYCPIFDLGS